MADSRFRRFLRGLLVYSAIIIVTLVVLDWICIGLNLFPPRLEFGDATLGWRPAGTSPGMQLGRCMEFSTGERIDYERNEDGIRINIHRDSLLRDTTSLKIAVSGDSHTELCAPNAQTHSGVTGHDLTSRGIPTDILLYGSGKYSPLQAYLAYRTVLLPYKPQIFILNLYTGNDFYDLLRVDDRPHFAGSNGSYTLAPPVWYSLDDPASPNRSRVLFALRTLADKAGVRGLYFRVTELRRLAAQQGGGLGGVFAYMNDLYKARDESVGYSAAFTAQILNQQLFFYHFPGSQEESLQRLRELMRLARRENPDVQLVMSPIPSYQLTGEKPVDSTFTKTLSKLPITYDEGVRQEQMLYDRTRELAKEEGWLFVDNLAALRGYKGTERLYNNYDYHLLPVASALVGHAQTDTLLNHPLAKFHPKS